MSSLYKRPDSPYYWWTARYKGRRLRKSTKMSKRHLAKKVQEQWDLNLMMGDLEFLGISTLDNCEITEYVDRYLDFVRSRKSDNTVRIAKGVLKKFSRYLESVEVTRLDAITVQVMDGYID